MSLLVEQGIPGATFYLVTAGWVAVTVINLKRLSKYGDGLVFVACATTSSVLIAIMIGDMFVDYLTIEVRIWFIGLAMVLVNLAQKVPLEGRAEDDLELSLRRGSSTHRQPSRL